MNNEVHVWSFSLAAPESALADLAGLLAPDERARADRFHFARHRNRYVTGRATMRTILARHLGSAPRTLRFEYTSFGKPFLPGTPLRFNLSHSHDRALLAVAWDREIGVDVERIRPGDDLDQVAERFFAPAERAALRSLPPPDRVAGFFRCWTRKEAYIKARGDGLSLDLHSFTVSLRRDEPAALLHANGSPSESSRWSMRSLDAALGYVAALALENAGQPFDLIQEDLAA